MININVLATGSKGNCYLIDDGHTSLLLEAGISVKQIKSKLWDMGKSLTQVGGCLISHSHGDHSLSGLGLMGAGIGVYASNGTAEACGWHSHRFTPVKSGQQIQIGSWSILPFDAVHDAPEPLGFLLSSFGQKLMFLTDSMYSPYRFSGVDIIMAECNYTNKAMEMAIIEGRTTPGRAERVRHNHMCLDTLIDLIQVNNERLSEIWVLHLSDDNSNEQEIQKAIQSVTDARVIIC